MLFFLFAQLAATAPLTRFELPNGLRVWVQEDRTRPVALVQITYKVGSLHETAGQTGIAHYVEHMVYRATQHVANEDIYGYIDRIGGRYTGGTWPEFTRYAETVPGWALESALRVTAERMCCALFDSTEFERERHNVVTEANGFSDTDPASTLVDAVLSAAFEVHPYRYNSNTWARDNLVLTRDEAFRWYKDHYGPNNAVLAIVGDVATPEVRRLVEKYFGGIPRAPLDGRVRIVEPPQRVEKRVTMRAPAKGTQWLEIAYQAPQAAHSDFPTLRVLRGILGSRLVDALGGRGAPEFHTADSASQYPYLYRFAIPRDTAADLERVLAIVDSAVVRLGRDGPTPRELELWRRPAGFLVADIQGTQNAGIPPRRSYLTRIADSLTARDAEWWEVSRALQDSIRARMTRVTAADVRAYVARWMRPSQRTVGMLIDAPREIAPRWSDDRTMAGDRMVIPPLTTPPAKRMRPEPVPPRALEPLQPIGIPVARRVLSNGIVVRAASLDTTVVSIHVRGDSGAASATGGHADDRLTGTASMLPALADSLSRIVRAGGVPGTITVSVVGPRAPSQLLDVVSRRFASLPKPRAPAPTAADSRDEPGERREHVVGATQVAITARLPGVPRDHPDRRALELLAYIVGVPSYGGRLGWALTKTGLTYSAAARTVFGASSGSLTFTTTCDTRNTTATIQAIREVIEGVGVDGVADWELREAQAFTLGRTLLYGVRRDSGIDAVADALLDSETAGIELLDLPALSRAYLSISLDEINRVARKYYRPEALSITATGAVPQTDEAIFPAGTFRSLFARQD